MTRGVEEVIEKEKLGQKLKSGRQLRIKLGIDPTSPNIHIGRAVPLLKLRDFQELGHQIVFIIGDFTAVIGDTSDKDSERPMLSEKQVKENMKKYIEQAARIIDIKKCKVYFNSKWLKKIGYRELSNQADIFSLSDFISRDNIKKRLTAGKRVSLRELIYPLMQGYDSVEVKADVEIGGTDQKFNLLAGRDLQKLYQQEPQDVITFSLLEGLDGRKMSSSWGNTINLFDSAFDMYGKIMSLKDEFIIKYFVSATRVSLSQIDEYKKQLTSGINPKDIKMRLAYELVKFYHDENDAKKAEKNFIETFSKGGIPEDIQEVKGENGKLLSEILLGAKVVESKSDFRRLVLEGAVSDAVSGEKITDPNYKIGKAITLRVGKKRFVKIV